MTSSVGVVVFPGTNCEHDVAWAIEEMGGRPRLIFHRAADLPEVDAVVVPGGFAHGDYLRTGAMARFSPVMRAVSDFAAAGGPLVGICNGFQILCEAGLLPGALQKNSGLRFLCRPVHIRVERADTALTRGVDSGRVLDMPINHFEGNYVADSATLERLEGEGQVVFRYCRPDGEVDVADDDANPNGSANAIAGVCSPAGNVVGLMPHPERASDPLLGSADGRLLLQGLLGAVAGARR